MWKASPSCLRPTSSTPSNWATASRSEEHTSELQSPCNLVCRLLLEKKKEEKASLRHGASKATSRDLRSVGRVSVHLLEPVTDIGDLRSRESYAGIHDGKH